MVKRKAPETEKKAGKAVKPTIPEKPGPSIRGPYNSEADAAESNPMTARAHNVDPYSVDMSMDAGTPYSTFHPGAGGLDYYQLRAMSRVPTEALIIQTMLNNIVDKCVYQTSPYESGFVIKTKNPKQKMTRATEAKAFEIAKVILAGGGDYYRGGMPYAVSAMMRDSLVLDQANAEILRDRLGTPMGYVPVDAATMRIAKPTARERATGQVYREPGEAAFIERDNMGGVVNAWEEMGMLWGVRRNRSDQGLLGYGYPEGDDLCGVTTWMMNALTANAVTFTNGMHASTILGFMANYSEEQWRGVTRAMSAMLTGVRNAKRTVMTRLDPELKEDIKAVQLGMSNKDMEFGAYMNFLLKVSCGLRGMDPAEVNFVFGNEGQTSSLSQKGPGERLQASKNKGLWPTLGRLASWFNFWIVEPIDPDFTMEFTGRYTPTESERLDMIVKQLGSVMTVDEGRALLDLKPIGGMVGGAILNSYAMQAMMAEQQQQQGDAQDAQGGPQDDAGDEGDIWGGTDLGDGDEEPTGAPEPVSKARLASSIRAPIADMLSRAEAGLAKGLESGAFQSRRKGGPRPGRKLALVESLEPGVKAWVVEVE